MLVLSRTRDESIMIGDEVEITIVDIRGDKVRLGITAPAQVPVHRKEVYDAIKRENAQAARLGPADLSGDTGPPDKGPPRPPNDRRNHRRDKRNGGERRPVNGGNRGADDDEGNGK